MYSPTTSLTDPPASSPIADSVLWVQGAALGSIATTVAVLAIAAIGLLMLSGRLELRRGFTAVIGCFFLFGAPSIALALISFGGAEQMGRSPAPIGGRPLKDSLHRPAPPASAYDPYAGASVPIAQ